VSASLGTPARPVRAIVEELVRGGVTDVVVCPGSRSTPLALALQASTQLRTWVHLDERSGAFFALGLAKVARRPSAILATSGTAVVNFAPAVAEARYGRVPLLLLTADRPPELQGVGAPQTIDQTDLYGRHAKWFVALPVPEDSDELESEVRIAVARALDVATAPPAGPVQLDVPFREPLLPAGQLRPDEVAVKTPAVAAPPGIDDVDRAMAALAGARRPLLVCGPSDEPELDAVLARLAAAIDAPLLADGLSGLRLGAGPHRAVIVNYDALLRDPPFRRSVSPDFVLRFGAPPTSKTLNQLLDGLAAPQLLVDEGGGWNMPARPEVIACAPVPFAIALIDTLDAATLGADPAWLARWRAADEAAGAALDSWFERLREPFEGAVPRAIVAAAPDDAVVVVGNSMPVRDVDAFLPRSTRRLRWLGNRGANGIDGMLSTALGCAAGGEAPVLVVLGDLSLLHDLTALLAAARLELDLTVLLVNNDGGGIFSFLPQADADLPEAGLPEAYETLFGTPHGADLGPLVSATGARHRQVDERSLGAAVEMASRRPGLDVIELRTERARNVALHRDALATVAAALAVRS
jgi:2-succinyl-5-enolpyruvyl-6-hydroxy-3-cyclohexene-1-carboxylate synthase